MTSVAHLLNRTLTVARPARTDDNYGGGSLAYTTVGTVLARVSRPSAAERQVAEQAGERVTHDVYLQPDADVARGDLLSGDGQTFTVIAVTFPSRRDYLKADVREDP